MVTRMLAAISLPWGKIRGATDREQRPASPRSTDDLRESCSEDSINGTRPLLGGSETQNFACCDSGGAAESSSSPICCAPEGKASGSSSNSSGEGWQRMPVFVLLCVQGAMLLATAVYFCASIAPPLEDSILRAEAFDLAGRVVQLQALVRSASKEGQELRSAIAGLHTKQGVLRKEVSDALAGVRARLHESNPSPYLAISGLVGHHEPPMYGKVREKTIWSFWHHAASCTAPECAMPAHLQLCVATVRRNRGDFDYKIVYHDQVSQYVTMAELPVRWRSLTPKLQRESLMNALLARYGGIALDLAVVLFRPLDDHWKEMVDQGATFRGYMYRINGQPWRRSEATVPWFLMSRREGIFNTAVRQQVIGLGDMANAQAYGVPQNAMGDQTITPILGMFDYWLPKCSDDLTVKRVEAATDAETPGDRCPELRQPSWWEGLSGPSRDDTRILLRDPRDGPLLPFSGMRMTMWKMNASLPLPPEDIEPSDAQLGGPTHGMSCWTTKDCWENVFLQRYGAVPWSGQARLLDFVKLDGAGEELQNMSKKELLSDNTTFFYNWLKLAGLPTL